MMAAISRGNSANPWRLSFEMLTAFGRAERGVTTTRDSRSTPFRTKAARNGTGIDLEIHSNGQNIIC
jgi:hypothetical protein